MSADARMGACTCIENAERGGGVVPWIDSKGHADVVCQAQLDVVCSQGKQPNKQHMNNNKSKKSPAMHRSSMPTSPLQTDLQQPRHTLQQLQGPAGEAWAQRIAASITAAVTQVQADGLDARVLCLGSCAGLWAVTALRAGAHHVTCAERYADAVLPPSAISASPLCVLS